MSCQPTLPKAILLDRDGVINIDSPDYILTPDQWIAIPGSLKAIALLKQHGMKIGLVSNQSALGRKMLSDETFQAIQTKMIREIEGEGGGLDHIIYCPHRPDDACTCRKPLPGMIDASLAALGLRDEPQSVIMIGDSLRDVQSAVAGGITPILVQSGYGNRDDILRESRKIAPSIRVFSDLLTAVQALLASPCL